MIVFFVGFVLMAVFIWATNEDWNRHYAELLAEDEWFQRLSYKKKV